MKRAFRAVCAACFCMWAVRCSAQLPFLTPHTPALQFVEAWTAPLPDHVKLFESAPLLNNDNQSLALLLAGSNPVDLKRTALITHWDGFRFVTDAHFPFVGWTSEPFLAGRFSPPQRQVILKGSKKHTPAPVIRQLVTAGGIYTWNGGSFVLVSQTPPAVKLSLVFTKSINSLLVGGVGDASTVWKVEQGQYLPSHFVLNPQDEGSTHWGFGTQPYDGKTPWQPGLYYVQTFWNRQYHWQVYVKPGTLVPDKPGLTTGDELEVFIPKQRERERTCWELTKPEDFDMAWRSGALGGHILDVRVGDPRNEGKAFLLVLMEDPATRKRTLLAFLPEGGHRL